MARDSLLHESLLSSSSEGDSQAQTATTQNDTGSKQKKTRPRQEGVDPNAILPKDISRSRRTTSRQRYSAEQTHAAQQKKIQRLERELAKARSQKKKTTAKRMIIDSDGSGGEHTPQDSSDLSPESEEEDDFITPFRSKGVVEPSGKKELPRLSQASSKEPSQHSGSLSRSCPPSPSSPSIGDSSRPSSRLSEQHSSSSISVLPKDSNSRSAPLATKNKVTYVYEEIGPHRQPSRSPSFSLDAHRRHRSKSPYQTGRLAQYNNKNQSSSKTAKRHRGRSPSTKELEKDASQLKKVRVYSPAASATPDGSALARKYDPMEYAGGKLPEKGKPKDSDYARACCNLVKFAIKRYLLKIYTEHAFPDDETAATWATRAWRQVCADAQKTFAPKDNDRVHTLLISRASSARGHLRDEIKQFVIIHYNLKVETSKKTHRDENAKAIARLMEGAPPRFCYKDYNHNKGYAEIKFLLQALQIQLFKDRDDIGTENSAVFDPLPLPTLALGLTILEFCLDAWSDGQYNGSLKLEDKNYRPKYDAHLAQLQDYQNINPPVFKKIRARMFQRICNMSKILITSAAASGISAEAQSRAKAELEGRTGDTDSEVEEQQKAVRSASIAPAAVEQ